MLLRPGARSGKDLATIAVEHGGRDGCRMVSEQGTLIRQLSQDRRQERAVRYHAHGGTFGREPSFFELDHLSEALRPDEVVTIRCATGRAFICQALDHTNVCSVLREL